MRNLRSRLADRWLLPILVASFALLATVTVVVAAFVTDQVIKDYLVGAQDGRVGRDMDLAEAFYRLKMDETVAISYRMARDERVVQHLLAASQGEPKALQIISEQIVHKTTVPTVGGTYLVIVLDDGGNFVAARALQNDGDLSPVYTKGNWGELQIVSDVLSTGTGTAATEIIPSDLLAQVGLDGQARVSLLETPLAKPEPFDPREGTAGLALAAVYPVQGSGVEVAGAVLTAYLFNNDFTLVDRIQEVAGVDTVTIFFGDLRVSTNVLDQSGQRAIGTRISQEVFEQVLVHGEPFTGPAFVVDQWYSTRYEPLYDHRGQVVGSLYVGAKQASFQQLVNSFRGKVFLIAGAAVILAVLTAIPLAWSVSHPLTRLAKATEAVADGDWLVRLPANGRGEMRMLARSFNTMVEALQETQNRLVEKEKLASVGQLAAGVAHEINNPLGSVLLYADIMRKETPENHVQQREDLQMIVRETKRCKAIVNDLLNFSRQNQVLAQDVDLNRLLGEIMEEVRQLELYQQVELVRDLEPDLNHIQADPLQLRQVFLNLMNNAAEAMPHGGTLTVRTRQGPEFGCVSVQVQDTGVGIADENLRKLFTPFFTTKPIGKGTGLGLAITYGIIKMHRGQISVTSQVGEGTTFTITLPQLHPTPVVRGDAALN